MTGLELQARLAAISQQATLGINLSDDDSEEEGVVRAGNKEPQPGETNEEPAAQPPSKPKPKTPVPQSPATQPEKEVVTYQPTSSDEDSQGDEGNAQEDSAEDE